MIPSEWRTASDCNGASSCIEVASVDGCILVRDSKLGDASSVLRVPAPSWWSFLAAVKTGQTHTFGGVLWVADVDAGWLMWLRDEPDVTLSFDRAEVAAFVAGVRAGEFDLEALKASSSDSATVASGGHASGAPQKPPLAFVEPPQVSR
jgi:hypothetical protein